MGSWSWGAFENDDAADLTHAVLAAEGPEAATSVLAGALEDVTATTGYIEVREMNRGIAAAALIAARTRPLDLASRPEIGAAQSRLPDSVEGLRSDALEVVRRALEPTDNEWFELWSESPDSAKARHEVEKCRSALESDGPDTA